MPIIFDSCGMVEEAKKNPYTEVGKEVCPSHICTVWDKVSEFIQIQLSSGRGVRIPGLVTFNYKIFTTDINQKQVVVQRIPYMLISEDLVKKYALKSKRPAFVFDITEMPLNLSQITAETCLPRTCVETCIAEVIHAFMRALVMDDHVEFHFANIGRLVIRCREVQPIFCKDFLCKYAFCQEIVKDKACQYLP